MTTIEIPYLVVGAGPVGLMAGILLGRQGLKTLIVDRDPGSQTSPAAHVVNARTFEICRQAGLDMEAIERWCKTPEDAGHAIFMTRLNDQEIGRLPFEQQGPECLEHTPTPLRNLSQHRFESLLESEINRTQETEIRYRHQWEDGEQNSNGVISQVRDLETGETLEIRSRYLIAADGAGSRIRKSLGIEMLGPPKLQSFLMIHAETDLRTLVQDRPAVLYWLMDPEVGGVLVAHDIDREWVYMYEIDSDQESLEDYDEARCRTLFMRAIGEEHPLKIQNRLTWTMSAQTASKLRDERIFLVGDAAHRFPPTGGLGLNTGVQDIHALAWRLAAIQKGWAESTLLESYETERLPVALNNAEQSLMNAGKLLAIPLALETLEDRTTARMEATLASAKGRSRVEQAIAQQAEHFDMLGLQLGYHYKSRAVIPDGHPAPTVENPVREYIASARPGARLPHGWLNREGEEISSLDLVLSDGLTLFTGAEASAWHEAIEACAPRPIRLIRIGEDVADPQTTWLQTCGVAPEGALLVRPDQHVAWRSRSRPENPTTALQHAVQQILS